MIKKKMPTPLTAEQLKAKLSKADSTKIVIPAYANETSFGKVDVKDVKDFSHITIESVGYRQDTIGVDGTGKEHVFHGGPWIGFNWSVPGFGFGEMTIHLEEGKIVIDSERLGKDFVKALLCDMVDKAEVK